MTNKMALVSLMVLSVSGCRESSSFPAVKQGVAQAPMYRESTSRAKPPAPKKHDLLNPPTRGVDDASIYTKPFKVVSTPDDASGFLHHVEDAKGVRVELPADVEDAVKHALSPKLMFDDDFLIYDHDAHLKAYQFGKIRLSIHINKRHDVSTRRVIPLMQLLDEADVLHYQAASKHGLAIVERGSVCQPECEGESCCTKKSVRISLLSKLPQIGPPTIHTTLPKHAPKITCGGSCFPVEVQVPAPETVRYLVREGAKKPGDAQRVWAKVFPKKPLVVEMTTIR